VQFTVDGIAVGSPVPLTNGTTGNITIASGNAPTFLPIVGTHSLNARYLGSPTTLASQSGTLNIAVRGITSLAITGAAMNTSAVASVSLTIN
jgi:hypothetical protein